MQAELHLPCVENLSDSASNAPEGTAIITVCGGGGTGVLERVSNGGSHKFRLGLSGVVISQRDRSDATAEPIAVSDDWEASLRISPCYEANPT